MDVSPLTLNRLSVYLRCLKRVADDGVERISSKQMAKSFHLSASQIRKDLAHFGEFGIRGVGYEVQPLIDRLTDVLGLDRVHGLGVVGMGNLGSAIARHLGFNQGPFRVVAGFDNDPAKIGREIGGLVVEPTEAIAEVVAERSIEIGILAVPAPAAQELFEALADAGVRSVLNFAPTRLQKRAGVKNRNVDLGIYLEELVFYLAGSEATP